MKPFSAALSSGDKNAQNAIKTQQQHNELVIKRMNMIICTVTARCYDQIGPLWNMWPTTQQAPF